MRTNRVTDVSATVRARVDKEPALAAKLREVDEFLRRPLEFREESLPGRAIGGADTRLDSFGWGRVRPTTWRLSARRSCTSTEGRCVFRSSDLWKVRA